MTDIINNLYNLTMFLLGGCVVTIVVTVVYIVGIIKYTEKCRMLTKELD